MSPIKRNCLFLLRIFLKTLQRFNPACKPIVPANLTIYSCAVIFSFLFAIQRIEHTFIKDYGNLALSAWFFVLLMNFLEVVGETLNGHKDH